MSTLHEPTKATIEEKIAALQSALDACDGDAAVYGLLGVCAAMARDAAQRSWTLHYESEDRDDLMSEAEDALVFEVLQIRFSRIYPELTGQVESVLREAFEDEHFRLEDPLGWAEMNADMPTPGEARQ